MLSSLLHSSLLACATCMVDRGTPLYQAQQGAVIFMHLNHERPLIYKILLFAVAFVTVMFILFSFTQGDGLHMPGFEHQAVVEQQG